LLIAKADNAAPRGPAYAPTDASCAAQQAHLARLAAVERYPGSVFMSPDNLASQLAYTKIIDLLARAQSTSDHFSGNDVAKILGPPSDGARHAPDLVNGPAVPRWGRR
jgi:hypothetical protein